MAPKWRSATRHNSRKNGISSSERHVAAAGLPPSKACRRLFQFRKSMAVKAHSLKSGVSSHLKSRSINQRSFTEFAIMASTQPCNGSVIM
jgi:hypothetical protein